MTPKQMHRTRVKFKLRNHLPEYLIALKRAFKLLIKKEKRLRFAEREYKTKFMVEDLILRVKAVQYIFEDVLQDFTREQLEYYFNFEVSMLNIMIGEDGDFYYIHDCILDRIDRYISVMRYYEG